MAKNLSVIRGPILNPQPEGTVIYYADGAIVGDDSANTIVWIGDASRLPDAYKMLPARKVDGVLLPPFLDIHTHFPQHPIRGHFTKNIADMPPEGRLLAGLLRNVFPAERRCSAPEYTEQVIRAFAQDTLSHGVVGGAAYATVHFSAAEMALERLSGLWSVGPVLMNINCPDYLRTDETDMERDFTQLAEKYGNRVIVTDRFAVSVDTPLRRQGVALAERLGLRMQTHLNEQSAEKALVEKTLYPDYESYTDVYRRDGLLAHQAILAHCIQMTEPEWEMLADSGATVAHCPTSNTFLGSGILPLDAMPRTIPYAISTDVGASPTCSLLCEMAQFLKVHAGRSRRATPEEALYRATLAPAQILGIADRIGTFAPGRPLSYIEVALPTSALLPSTAAEAILAMLDMPELTGEQQEALNLLESSGLEYGASLGVLTADIYETEERLRNKVQRTVLKGKVLFSRRNDLQKVSAL